jgi:hypothetical protein
MSTLRKHLKYAKYLFWHKWYVFLECLNVGLVWRGIKHDWTKLLPSEWFAYAAYDFSKGLPKTTGYNHQFNPSEMAFNVAMNHHHKRNPHHWEYWVLVNKDGSTYAIPMPDKCVKEMIADWRGAGKAQGRPDTPAWYKANRDKMVLHPDTRVQVDRYMGFVA